MKRLVTILLLCCTQYCLGQIKSVIVNSETQEPIPYVNIWIENENIGTTSDENGVFSLNSENTKNIIFSAIGFETTKINTENIQGKVSLKPKNIELSEVIITPQKRSQKLVIGKFKKSKINHYFGAGGSKTPWIVARYFPYKSEYKNTPFLMKIRMLTDSDVKNAKFNIRLYRVDKNGKPSAYLYDKNIIGIARKGKHITEFDIADLQIKFPQEGFFIAVEWLVIPENKHEYSYTMKGSKKKYKGFSYEPAIGTVPTPTNENTWIFVAGKWKKIPTKAGEDLKRYKGKYNLLALELTLTN